MKCGNDKCKMNFGETLGCAIWKRSDKCRNFIQADGVPDSSPPPCSLSDSDMIDWMQSTGNGLWLNPSTQMWECDDGSDCDGFRTIREAVQSAMKQNVMGEGC